ncbi:MAG: peptidylprolyl isomerase [Melioribacteraceae bacterium]|nr:peptidylprolyl isomerase [Melioribacteraceae bacterium]
MITKAFIKTKNIKKKKEWTYKQALLAFLKDREVYGNIDATDKEIREAFVKMNQTLKARHLYAKTKEEAEQLYQLLQTGASFESLAAQVFTDSTLRKNGGYVGEFTWGDMDPAFEEAAYSLEIGEISEPVKTRTGYSIIKVEDKEYNPLLTEYQFLQKKSQIETTIKIRKKKPSEQDFVDSLFDREKFRIKNEGVSTVLNSLSENFYNLENFEDHENQPVAEYNGKIIYADEIIGKIEKLPEFHRTKIRSEKALNAAIEGFVIQDILLQEAESKGYDDNEILQRKYDTMLNNLFLKYKVEEVAKKTEVEDSVLKKYYENNLDFFSTYNEINIQEIIVDSKNLANQLKDRLAAGEDFGKLAQEYSLREWSAKNNGEIGFAPLSKFGILKCTFWDTSVGDLLGPREIDGYYGLFKILGKKESKPIEYNSIKEEVLKVFREDRQNQLLFKYISHLQDSVDTYVDEELLSSLNFKLLN